MAFHYPKAQPCDSSRSISPSRWLLCALQTLGKSDPQTQSLLTLHQHVLCALAGPSPHLIPVFHAMFKVLKLTPASMPLISPFLTTLPEPHPPSLSLLRKQPSSSFSCCASPQTRVVHLGFLVGISTALCSNRFM